MSRPSMLPTCGPIPYPCQSYLDDLRGAKVLIIEDFQIHLFMAHELKASAPVAACLAGGTGQTVRYTVTAHQILVSCFFMI